MRVHIECDDIVVVLSRVLDQTRRMGIGISGISAAGGTVVMTLDTPPDHLSQTLGRRVELIAGVTSLVMQPAVC